MPAYTQWPLRRALSRALRDVIISVGLPSINGYLSANMIPAATAVQIGEASLVLGNLPNISGAVVEIDQPQQQVSRIANDTFGVVLVSTITLSLTRAGDSDPEDFKFVGDVLLDMLFDVFNQESQTRLRGLHSDGTPYLPEGKPFQDCWCYLALHPKTRQADANNVTMATQWTLYHTASITYSNTRPDALGLQ